MGVRQRRVLLIHHSGLGLIASPLPGFAPWFSSLELECSLARHLSLQWVGWNQTTGEA